MLEMVSIKWNIACFSRYAPPGLKWYMIYAFYQYYAPLGLKFHTPQLALVYK
jgi:hypothetical protein